MIRCTSADVVPAEKFNAIFICRNAPPGYVPTVAIN